MILGEVKARPKDIISFSLDYISKSKVQTSNPSSSPISLDTPARPADLLIPLQPFQIKIRCFLLCDISVIGLPLVGALVQSQPSRGVGVF